MEQPSNKISKVRWQCCGKKPELSQNEAMNDATSTIRTRDFTSTNSLEAKESEDEGRKAHKFWQRGTEMTASAQRKSKSAWLTVRGSVGRLEMMFYTIVATVAGGTLGFVVGVCGC